LQAAEAEELLHRMCRNQIKPTEVSFNTVIAAYGTRGSGHKAFKIFNEV
jgi:pentatricopeptide repeat protein